MESTSPNSVQPPGEPPGIESLLEYEPFVRAVARGLLREEAEVDDLVQETWARGLRRPPGHGRALKAWLARVVRNLAMDLRRGEGRRRAREEAVREAPMSAEPVDELQSRLEAHREVVSSVLSLEEPYQGVVMLVYYQGMSPGEAAEKLGRKPATVRTQLCRAHELLRKHLDDRFDGDRAAWAILAVPFGWPTAPLPVGKFGAGNTGLGAKALMVALLAAAVVFVPDWSRGHRPEPNKPRPALLGLEDGKALSSTGDARPLEDLNATGDLERGARSPFEGEAQPAALPPALVVHAKDATGQPIIGLPIVLGGGVDRGRFEDLAVAEVLPEGASFRAFEDRITMAGEPTSVYRLRPSIPGLDQPEVLVGLPPGELQQDREVELELGPTASVVVELRRSDGELYDFAGDVQMTLKGQLESLVPSAPLEHGRARFGWVGLGGELIARVRVPSLGLNWDFTAPGPTRPGQELVVPFEPELKSDLPSLAGRALDKDGVPLVDAGLVLSILSSERVELARLRVQTNQNGGFFAQAPEKVRVGSELLIWVLCRGDESWEARAQTSLTLGPHGNSLGDLCMLDVGSLIEGRFVDQQGEPLEGVQVVAAQEYFEVLSSSTSGPDGHFELHGLFPERVRLRVLSPVWVPSEELSVTPGSDEVQLPLVRGGRVTGSLAVIDGVDPTSFRITAERMGERTLPSAGPEGLAAVSGAGAFSLKGLETGSYAVRVYRRGELVSEEAGVAVTAGGRTHLGELNVAEDLYPLRLSVLDAKGRPARGVTSKLFAGERLLDRATGDGEVVLASSGPVDGLTVTLEARGARPQVLRLGEGLDLSEPIHLKAGVEVELVVPHVPVLELGAIRATAYLEWLDAPEPLESFVRLPRELLEAKGGTLRLPGPGLYRLAVVLHRPGGDSPRTPYGSGDYLLDVQASDDGALLELALPPSLIR